MVSLEDAPLIVSAWCDRRTRLGVPDEYRIEAEPRGAVITIVEVRAPWQPQPDAEWSRTPVAQLRCDRESGAWSVRWQDSSNRWHPYDVGSETTDLVDLLIAVDDDPDGVFWG